MSSNEEEKKKPKPEDKSCGRCLGTLDNSAAANLVASAVCFSLAVGTRKNVSGLAISSGQVISGFFLLFYLPFAFILTSMSVCAPVQRVLWELVFLLPCGVQELNTDLQAWWRAPLPAQPPPPSFDTVSHCNSGWP